MDVRIEQIGKEDEELVLIRCRAVTEEVREIAAFVKSRQGSLSGTADAKRYEIAVAEICYIESVDGKTFLYTGDGVFETAYRIYELEEMLKSKHFPPHLQGHAGEPHEDPVDPARLQRALYGQPALRGEDHHFEKLCQGAQGGAEGGIKRWSSNAFLSTS